MDTRAGVPRVYGVTFEFDNRNRLIEEQRGAVNHPYYLRYTYDQAGNRKDKTDVLTGVVTKHTYDVSDPFAYGSQGNRLMYSVTYQGSPSNLLEERWYTYNAIGHVDHVIRRIEGDVDASGNQWYRGTRLFYAKNGRLWIARSVRWQLDPELPGQAVACEALAAMEYRYDSGRQRYLVRARDPDTMLPISASDGKWSDYDGDSIYGDYALGGDPLSVANTMAHEPGLAQFDHALSDLHHLHGNLIGTTECMSDDTGAITHRPVYTAFGEPVHSSGSTGTRYGYAGAWGYQAAANPDPLAELGWLHIGERYYDPTLGRFVQRDPLGIEGGLNVYAYCGNEPTVKIDPDGLEGGPSSVMTPRGLAILIEQGEAVGKAAMLGGKRVVVQSVRGVTSSTLEAGSRVWVKFIDPVTGKVVTFVDKTGKVMDEVMMTIPSLCKAINDEGGGSSHLGILVAALLFALGYRWLPLPITSRLRRQHKG